MSFVSEQARQYTCKSCGATSDTWFARCPSCQAWSSTKAPVASSRVLHVVPDRPERVRAPARAVRREVDETEEAEPEIRPVRSVPVPVVDIDVSKKETRIETGIEPLDRVLGGGIVVGSLVLLGGDPGTGKSTMLMQMASQASCDGPRLYASGEETETQVAMRAHRIKAIHPDIKIVHETDVDEIIWHAIDQRARLVVIDSIHAISSSKVSGIAGSDYQVKTCAQLLMAFAKKTGIATIVISHVNKNGAISGPKNFEHVGDVTLMFENNELGDPWRTLRAEKNRFGSTLETGMFVMGDEGLVAISKGQEPDLVPVGPVERAPHDEMLPIAQELVYRILELGGDLDPGLRDRIAGRLDVVPRSAP